jgi:hypothetical protein
VLALIDDLARWPATAKATRACDQLRKVLVAAIDALKADAIPALPLSGNARHAGPGRAGSEATSTATSCLTRADT